MQARKCDVLKIACNMNLNISVAKKKVNGFTDGQFFIERRLFE